MNANQSWGSGAKAILKNVLVQFHTTERDSVTSINCSIKEQCRVQWHGLGTPIVTAIICHSLGIVCVWLPRWYWAVERALVWVNNLYYFQLLDGFLLISYSPGSLYADIYSLGVSLQVPSCPNTHGCLCRRDWGGVQSEPKNASTFRVFSCGVIYILYGVLVVGLIHACLLSKGSKAGKRRQTPSQQAETVYWNSKGLSLAL